MNLHAPRKDPRKNFVGAACSLGLLQKMPDCVLDCSGLRLALCIVICMPFTFPAVTLGSISSIGAMLFLAACSRGSCPPSCLVSAVTYAGYLWPLSVLACDWGAHNVCNEDDKQIAWDNNSGGKQSIMIPSEVVSSQARDAHECACKYGSGASGSHSNTVISEADRVPARCGPAGP